MFAEDDLRPISALQHLLFCERQCALIHVEQLWAENSLTLTGRHLHEKVDAGRKQRRGTKQTTRSLPLRSLTLGLYGKADVVEFLEPQSPDAFGDMTDSSAMSIAPSSRQTSAASSRIPFPVEYKRGKPKKNRCDEVQLCAQAMCLEEMLGIAIPAGAIFYGTTRRRHDVPFNAALRDLTLGTIRRLHEMLDSGTTPTARKEKKCERCSLLNLCLPEGFERRRPASQYVATTVERLLDWDASNERESQGPAEKNYSV